MGRPMCFEQMALNTYVVYFQCITASSNEISVVRRTIIVLSDIYMRCPVRKVQISRHTVFLLAWKNVHLVRKSRRGQEMLGLAESSIYSLHSTEDQGLLSIHVANTE